MTQSRAFDTFVDNLMAGEGPDRAMEKFVRSALVEVQAIAVPVRYPVSRKAWPADVWAEMQAIRRGEVE